LMVCATAIAGIAASMATNKAVRYDLRIILFSKVFGAMPILQ
jgi:hypothetical protein